MNLIFRLAFLLLAGVLWGSPPAEGFADLQDMNYLKTVTSDSKDGELTVRLEFRSPVKRPRDPEFFNKSFQMDFPNAYVEPAKRFFSTGDNEVPQVFAAQFDRRTLRVRFIFGDGAGDFRDNVHIEREGRFLRVRIQKGATDVLARFLARAAAEDTVKSSNTESESEPKDLVSSGSGPIDLSDRVQKLSYSEPDETVSTSPPSSKATRDKSSPAAGSFLDVQTSDESEPLGLMPSSFRMLTMLSLVLGLVFVLFFLFKKFVLKNTMFGGDQKAIQVLGTGFLGPKKNIALVEVAGEVLVLGIANDTISLLANIREPERIDRIKSAGDGGNSGLRWNPKTTSSSDSTMASNARKSGRDFSKILNQASRTQTEAKSSVAAVTAQIRQNLGRMRTV